jgi:hypothetical protein
LNVNVITAIVDQIKQRVIRHGLDIALRHFDQAEASFAANNWEAANSQYRSFLEALFDGVAAIRLRTAKKAGAARKQLQDQGLLTEHEGDFLQAFMALAGEHGSHAGISTDEQALSRRLIALGTALTGLSLLPELVRVQDVLTLSPLDWKGHPAPTDADVTTSCPTCRTAQNLNEASVRRDGEETVYTCKNGCQPIVVVGVPGDSHWPGRGYRLGSHVIRNAQDLRIRVEGASADLLIRASPASLMKKRPE